VSSDSLDRVNAEIQREAARVRESGEFSPREEQDLKDAFWASAALQSDAAILAATLADLDRSMLIDPAVPVDSARAGGAVMKKSLRKAMYFYVRWITDQASKSFSTIAAALHLIEEDLGHVHEQLTLPSRAEISIIDEDERDGETWWSPQAFDRLRDCSAPIVVSACGNGWLVEALGATGATVSGIDPREARVQEAQRVGRSVTAEDIFSFLSRTSDQSLGGIILTGTTEAVPAQRRGDLLTQLERVVTTDGVLLIHSLHPDALEGDLIPVELDLAGVKPLRPQTWASLLSERGFQVTIESSPDARSFLVVAAR